MITIKNIPLIIKLTILAIVVIIISSCVTLSTTVIYDGDGSDKPEHYIKYNDNVLVASSNVDVAKIECFIRAKKKLDTEPKLPSIPRRYSTNDTYIANRLLDHYEDIHHHIDGVVADMTACQNMKKH